MSDKLMRHIIDFVFSFSTDYTLDKIGFNSPSEIGSKNLFSTVGYANILPAKNMTCFL